MKSNLKFFKIIITFLFSLLFFSCADLFQNKIDMKLDNTNGTLSDILLSEEKITYLEPPSQLFVSQGTSSSTIFISWSNVNNALTYRLERAIVEQDIEGNFNEPEEDAYETIVFSGYNTEMLSTNSFEDLIIDEPNALSKEYSYRFFYRVRAENKIKHYEESSFITTQLNNSGYLFAPPKNTSADMGISTDNIKITWTKALNCDKYYIYRSTNSDGTAAEKIASVTSNQNWYTDLINASDKGKEFFYLVYAHNKNGTLSAPSNIAMGYTLVDGAPAKVNNVHVTDGRGFGNSIKIAWSSVGDIKYSVYRTSSEDATLILLKQSVTETVYTDSSSLKPNTYYYYQIQAWKDDETGNKIKGPISDSGPKSTNPAEGFILSPPENIYIEKTISSTTLFFTPSIGNEEERLKYTYEVYGDNLSTGTFDSIITTIIPNNYLLTTEGFYSVILSQNYSFYKIKTVNMNNIQSTFSQITAPSPLSANNIEVSKNAFLKDKDGINWTANSAGVYPVQIKWTKSPDLSTAGYNIYRSTKPDSSFRKINEEPLSSDTEVYFDINETSKSGKCYFYKVLAVNSLNQGQNYTDCDWGYGTITADQYMREYNKTVKASQKKLTLMHKSGNTDKLGTETIYGDLSGSLYYNASISGFSGVVTMYYKDYADFYIHYDGTINTIPPSPQEIIIGNTSQGYYFFITGNTNTKAGTDTNGSMNGTTVCTGMYPGQVGYDSIDIKGGAAGGGTYKITRDYFGDEIVSYVVGNE